MSTRTYTENVKTLENKAEQAYDREIEEVERLQLLSEEAFVEYENFANKKKKKKKARTQYENDTNNLTGNTKDRNVLKNNNKKLAMKFEKQNYDWENSNNNIDLVALGFYSYNRFMNRFNY